MDTTCDRIVIDPGRKELTRLLNEAAAAANAVDVGKKFTWPAADLSAVLKQLAGTPEGMHGWNAGAKKRYFAGRSQLTLLWWSDALGRKHVRVLGGQGVRLCERTRMDEYGKLSLGPLQHIYPEKMARAWHGEGPRFLLGVCDCGAVGSPATLAWMGECCGPCHDQRAEGHAPPKARAFQSPANWWSSLIFTPDGSSLLSAWKGLWRYDLATGAVTAETAPGVAGSCYGIRFTPDGERLVLLTLEDAAGGGDQARVTTWDIHKQAATSWTIEVNYNIPRWALSPDCETVAVRFERPGRKKEELNVYRVRDGKVRHKIPVRGACDLCFSPDGKRLVVSDYYLPPRVWDAGTGKQLREADEKLTLGSMVWRADGTRIAGFESGPARGWLLDPDSGETTPLGDLGHRQINFSTFDPTGRVLVAGGSYLTLWNLAAGTPRFDLSYREALLSAAWSPDGRWLATSDKGGSVRLWSWPALAALVGA